MYRILSAAVLFIHFIFVIFVIAGFLYILSGWILKLAPARNYSFRIIHLCSVVYVTVQAWLGKICPLTILESSLRTVSGRGGYDMSFMEYWIEKLIYYDFPFIFFLAAYSVFLLIVAALMFLYPPEKKKRKN